MYVQPMLFHQNKYHRDNFTFLQMHDLDKKGIKRFECRLRKIISKTYRRMRNYQLVVDRKLKREEMYRMDVSLTRASLMQEMTSARLVGQKELEQQRVGEISTVWPCLCSFSELKQSSPWPETSHSLCVKASN